MTNTRQTVIQQLCALEYAKRSDPAAPSNAVINGHVVEIRLVSNISNPRSGVCRTYEQARWLLDGKRIAYSKLLPAISESF